MGPRWYVNGPVVERNATGSIRGTWSPLRTGAGPTVGILVPGDLSSDSEVAHGDFLHISGMGAGFRDVGIYLPDGTRDGLAFFTDEATRPAVRDADAVAASAQPTSQER